MYAGINVLTKLMYFQQILYLLGVNKYYGYGSMKTKLYTVASFLTLIHQPQNDCVV
jgi:hypothetical protein